MPTYEYACKGCGEHLEVVQSFKDDPLTECPACGGTLRKVFSAAGLIFKGSGWHSKDYANAGRSSSSSGSSREGTSESNTSSGSDASGKSSDGASSDSGSSDSGSSASTSKDAGSSGSGEAKSA